VRQRCCVLRGSRSTTTWSRDEAAKNLKTERPYSTSASVGAKRDHDEAWGHSFRLRDYVKRTANPVLTLVGYLGELIHSALSAPLDLLLKHTIVYRYDPRRNMTLYYY